MTGSDREHVVRRLPWSAEQPADQLASGPALLAGMEQRPVPALRWYGFATPAMLLGSSQRLDEVDAPACAAAGVSIHRRRSGGGAVLGDYSLLMLDLAIPREHRLYLDDISESYRWLGEVWVAALAGLGLAAWAIPIAEARADTQALDPLLKRVCFGGRSPYEVVRGPAKVVGLAQVRRRAGALFQCGIYLRWEPQRTAGLMAATAAERAALAEMLAQRVAGLEQYLGQVVPAHVQAGFEAALEQSAGLCARDDDWSAGERAARAADRERYAALTVR